MFKNHNCEGFLCPDYLEINNNVKTIGELRNVIINRICKINNIEEGSTLYFCFAESGNEEDLLRYITNNIPLKIQNGSIESYKTIDEININDVPESIISNELLKTHMEH